MSVCYLGLGGNAGDVLQSMDRGLAELARLSGIRVCESSDVYRTTPSGSDLASPFLNAAVRIESDRAPATLLHDFQKIEDDLGRDRQTRWSARPLDIDLLLFGEVVFAEPFLTIPHPHMWYRRFVLDPLVQIAPDVFHPVMGVSIVDLRSRLMQRPFRVLLTGGDSGQRSELLSRLPRHFPGVLVAESPPDSEADHSISLTLNLAPRPEPWSVGRMIEAARERMVFLSDIPGSIDEAADAVLTAALDAPVCQSRPLRRIP